MFHKKGVSQSIVVNEKDEPSLQKKRLSTNSISSSSCDDNFSTFSSSIERKACKAKNQLFTATLSSQSRSKAVARVAARRWLQSFTRCDPRWQIHQYFSNDMFSSQNINGATTKPEIFTVFRPTSYTAIQRMLVGEATGKGLEIKGKSAKAGALSGYVPYLQIHEESHKTKCQTLPKSGRTRIYFGSQEARDRVFAEIEPVQKQMVDAVNEATQTVRSSIVADFSQICSKRDSKLNANVVPLSVQTSSITRPLAFGLSKRDKTSGGANPALSKFKTLGRSIGKSVVQKRRVDALKTLLWAMDDSTIAAIDSFAPQCYGIELPDRLLWQVFVVKTDISRPEDSDFFTGRPSQPAFQNMNFNTIYKTQEKGQDEARVVLWQACGTELLAGHDPMDPRGFIMAYEENGQVLPVVSDFDCFTMGTRGLTYETPLPQEQIELLKWSVSQIGLVLDDQHETTCDCNQNWTARWLEVLKRSAAEGFHPEIPPFGFGDAKSYSIMENAVSQLKGSGAIRHGSECFNYYFPQELDEDFLIVSKTVSGNRLWEYVTVKGLQDFLLQRIDEGYIFPLNPKWILCDDGWKEVYDRMLAINNLSVQQSLDVWFPRESGIRETIESIHKRNPAGFAWRGKDEEMDGTAAMDLATMKLKQYMIVRVARAKLHSTIAFRRLLRQVRLARLPHPRTIYMERE